MFERDKAELRDLGIPLETGRNSALRQPRTGTGSPAATTSCRRSSSTPAEAAAVGLAARLWQSATLGEPARNALIKLRAGGTDVAAGDAPGAVPHLDASDPSLPGAARRRPHARVVALRLPQGRRASMPERRTLEPWGVLSWRRRWYVAATTATAASRAASGCPASPAASSWSGRPARSSAREVDLLAWWLAAGPDDPQSRTVAGDPAPGWGSCAGSPTARRTAC